jgi:high-affinity iron transporter
VGAAFLVALREGIEAALIISILLAYLKQVQAHDRRHLVWWGTALAVVVSIVIGTVIFAVGAEFEGEAEEVFEGLVTLTAVGVLTWMIFWMRRQGARVKSELHERVDTALLTGGFALAALAFVAVLREGVETALFIFAAAKGTAVESGGIGGQLFGAFLGLALAVVLGVALYRGGLSLNLRSFFRVTGALLIVVAAGLFAYGLHELQEAGWLPMLAGTAFDVSSTFPDDSGAGGILRAIFGYQANPTWLELAGWFGYIVIVGGLFLRPARRWSARPNEAVATSPTQESARVGGDRG